MPQAAADAARDRRHARHAAISDAIADARRRLGRPAEAQPGRRRGDDHRLPALLAAGLRDDPARAHACATTSSRRSSAAAGAKVYVGGVTAGSVDFANTLGHKLPLFIGVVVLLSALLLMIVFRSLVIPLQAAVMNLLSIGAALGVIVAIFQWGWLGSLIGVQQGPIESFIPVMLFAIVFGLSMDYEVFLVSRIHERWTQTRDNSRAVAEGLALDRPRRHRRRGDHGLRLPLVHARRRPRDQGVRPQPRQRRVPRRAGRALPAAAGGAAPDRRRAPGRCPAGWTALLPRLNIEGTRAADAAPTRGRRRRRAGATRRGARPEVATEGAEG